jgi:diamine N-acetyltransferase
MCDPVMGCASGSGKVGGMGLRVRATTAADIDFVLAAEADPDALPFVIRWSREQHEHALADPDQAHLLVTEGSGPAGFVLLAGLTSEHHNIELRRIVVAPKGRQVGRQALSLVLDHAFGTLGAHRVWLDVKVHNRRARRAYAAVGFVDEGVLREALLTDGTYESLAVMSILEHEWLKRRVASPPRRPG